MNSWSADQRPNSLTPLSLLPSTLSDLRQTKCHLTALDGDAREEIFPELVLSSENKLHTQKQDHGNLEACR